MQLSEVALYSCWMALSGLLFIVFAGYSSSNYLVFRAGPSDGFQILGFTFSTWTEWVGVMIYAGLDAAVQAWMKSAYKKWALLRLSKVIQGGQLVSGAAISAFLIVVVFEFYSGVASLWRILVQLSQIDILLLVIVVKSLVRACMAAYQDEHTKAPALSDRQRVALRPEGPAVDLVAAVSDRV